jgi:hypothetical protein
MFKSEFDRPESYYEDIDFPTIGDYREMLRFKDRNTALYDVRWQTAKAVIDLMAETIGANLKGELLYGLDYDERSPLVDKLVDYFDRSGDKVKMKKRIDELENENRVLRSLHGK